MWKAIPQRFEKENYKNKMVIYYHVLNGRKRKIQMFIALTPVVNVIVACKPVNVKS